MEEEEEAGKTYSWQGGENKWRKKLVRKKLKRRHHLEDLDIDGGTGG